MCTIQKCMPWAICYRCNLPSCPVTSWLRMIALPTCIVYLRCQCPAVYNKETIWDYKAWMPSWYHVSFSVMKVQIMVPKHHCQNRQNPTSLLVAMPELFRDAWVTMPWTWLVAKVVNTFHYRQKIHRLIIAVKWGGGVHNVWRHGTLPNKIHKQDQ